MEIRKRSEHVLGQLLNPLDPESDDRDWISQSLDMIVHEHALLVDGGGPAWLDLPALRKIAITTNEVAKAFDAYNTDRGWAEQIRPFNFLLQAHHSNLTNPHGADNTEFRLLAPYESDPSRWLALPWVDINTGSRHQVTTTEIATAGLVLLKTYREFLLLYAVHPEPKSLDPLGNHCTRRSPPGLLKRRPVELKTLSLIGKESNRLDETLAGLTSDQDLLEYTDPGHYQWQSLVLPTLEDFSAREVAHLVGVDTRTVQRIKAQTTNKPRDDNRRHLTRVAAQLASRQLETWGIEPPPTALEQLVAYIDSRFIHAITNQCRVCGVALDNVRCLYCGERCRKQAYRTRQQIGTRHERRIG